MVSTNCNSENQQKKNNLLTCSCLLIDTDHPPPPPTPCPHPMRRFFEVCPDRGMKEHGAPDGRADTSWYHASIVQHFVCSESVFCRVTLGKILLPCVQEFPDPQSAPCEKKKKEKETRSDLESSLTVTGCPTPYPLHLAGHWELPGQSQS